METVHRPTGDRGIHPILEVVGGAHLVRSPEAAAAQGRVSLVGVIDVSAAARHLMLKSAIVEGIHVGHRRALEELVRAVDVTRIAPVIDRRYPLDDPPAALDPLDRGRFGLIAIEV